MIKKKLNLLIGVLHLVTLIYCICLGYVQCLKEVMWCYVIGLIYELYILTCQLLSRFFVYVHSLCELYTFQV
jgi:hypothetical protein